VYLLNPPFVLETFVWLAIVSCDVSFRWSGDRGGRINKLRTECLLFRKSVNIKEMCMDKLQNYQG